MHVILVYVNEQATCGVNGKDGKHEEWAHGGLVALIMMDHNDLLFL
jgi:hypothetical protein